MLVKLILALLIGTGVVFSVWDYRNWRWEETKNFGQGPGTAQPLALTKVYQNKIAGIRVRYPGEWTVTVGPRFRAAREELDFTDLVQRGERVEAAMIGEAVTLRVQRREVNMPDVVDAEEEEIEKQVKLMREREYLNTETASIAYMTWEREGQLYQRAMTGHGDRVLILDLEAGAGEEAKVFEETFKQILRSIVLI